MSAHLDDAIVQDAIRFRAIVNIACVRDPVKLAAVMDVMDEYTAANPLQDELITPELVRHHVDALIAKMAEVTNADG